jgi:ketosteroid isomerase-like protein
LRDADALVEMTNPDVVIRPFLARQAVDAVGYRGHEGVRDWIGSLDRIVKISLDLVAIDVTGERSAIVEADVCFEREGSRTGEPTFSVWRFDDGKLTEAVGYGSKDEALDAEHRSWH